MISVQFIATAIAIYGVGFFLYNKSSNKEVANAFLWYVTIRYIGLLFLYLSPYLPITSPINSLVIFLLPIIVGLTVAYIVLWKKGFKLTMKFLLVFLMIYLLFGSTFIGGTGLPLAITFYFYFKHRRIAKIS